MKQFFLRIWLVVGALLLRFRYRISYKGLNQVKELLQGGKACLFLPNHPAVVVDPLIVSIPLIRLFGVRPLIIDYMYYHPAAHWAIKLLDALPMPNFGTSFSPLKLKRAERSLQTISDGLKAGDRFLIYPSGTTKLQAREVVGGAFGVHQLVEENPDVPVVLVRITGLWGSSFSRAPTHGGQPHTRQALKQGVWTAIKNLFFFVPKRKVVVEFEVAEALPRDANKQQFNRYLEDWYNRPFGPEGEPLSLVSYAFWKEQFVAFDKKEETKIDLSAVPEEVKKQVIAKIAALAKVAEKDVLPDLKLIEHLGLDSLDHAELVAFLETEFDAQGVAPEQLVTVSTVLLYASGALKQKEQQESGISLKSWQKKRPHTRLNIPEGSSIPELFFKTADANLFEIACADPLFGPMTFYRCKKAVILLHEVIANLPGDNIGILLPASTTSYLLVLACQLANKTPVMINWTVGGKHLETVVEVAKLEAVISSWAFLDALDAVDLSQLEPLLVFLEELKANIGLLDLVKGAIKAYAATTIPDIANDAAAVILFTSGTEGMPKGVPLTHDNIISDLRAAVERVELYGDDKLLAMLPPFHSFGFSVTGLLPFIGALKTCFYPNPTDSKRLVKAIERWNITVLCSAPTFLKNILSFAKDVDTTSVRMVISGAEKAPDELFSLLTSACPKALFVEGYGITECSPVISANGTGNKKFGVGKPLTGIEVAVVDPENLTIAKPVGEVGLIIVSGPNVFSGYLNKGLHDPFVTIEGKSWYQTGDLGMLDKEGNLILSGRLKRFIKIGGEMISLAAIEETLMNQTDSPPNSFVVVTEGDLLGKVQLVLFSTKNHTAQEINQLLRKGGASNLVKIDRVIQLDEIPQTATGKIAYRQLDKLLTKDAP